MSSHIDFNETTANRDIMSILLSDHTSEKNIMWCTDDYLKYGKEYSADNEILIEMITGDKQDIIRPRVSKVNSEQRQRSKDMAEVFTPSWICNKQNNLIDNAWFGYAGAFNKEKQKTWVTTDRVIFPDGKDWKSYVAEQRLEITCGEAPYLVSRYDTTSGKYIEVKNRIGLLDRKLRVVSENAASGEEWVRFALKALRSVYGYEYQGDSLLIARENLFLTFIDFYVDFFKQEPGLDLLKDVASIISWNIWQMDGLKMVVPNSCGKKKTTNVTIFGDEEIIEECYGCAKNDIHRHNGLYCKVMDWETENSVEFINFVKGGGYGY